MVCILLMARVYSGIASVLFPQGVLVYKYVVDEGIANWYGTCYEAAYSAAGLKASKNKLCW
jgi:hypothetical protein